MNPKSFNTQPKVGFCSAYKQGYEIVKFITKQQAKTDFVATCIDDDSEYHDKIIDLCNDNDIKVIEKISGNDERFVSYLKDHNIDVVILAWWPSIINNASIKSVNIGWVNLHPTLLPYGRGKHGYYWSIVEDTPFGVSIHLIDEGIDTGAILFQKEINLSFSDTGQSAYEKGVDEVIRLFKDKYQDIISLNFTPVKQNEESATFHFAKEIEKKKPLDLNQNYKALDLINLIRARTFSDGPSLRVKKDGHEYYLRMHIEKIETS